MCDESSRLKYSLVETVVFSVAGAWHIYRLFGVLRAKAWLDGVRFKVKTLFVLTHATLALPVFFLGFAPDYIQCNKKAAVLLMCPLTFPIFVSSVLTSARTRDSNSLTFWIATIVLVGGTSWSTLLFGFRGLAWAATIANLTSVLIALRSYACGRRASLRTQETTTTLPSVQMTDISPHTPQTPYMPSFIHHRNMSTPFPRAQHTRDNKHLPVWLRRLNHFVLNMELRSMQSLDHERTCAVTFAQPTSPVIERGIFWLQGNPGDMYADMTQLKFSVDGKTATLRAEHIMMPEHTGLLYVLSLIPLLQYTVVFSFETKNQGFCTNAILGYHLPYQLVKWKFEIATPTHVIRESWGKHTYHANLILKYDAMRGMLTPQLPAWHALQSSIRHGNEYGGSLNYVAPCQRPYVFVHPRIIRFIVSPLMIALTSRTVPRFSTQRPPNMKPHACASICRHVLQADTADLDMLVTHMILRDWFGVSASTESLRDIASLHRNGKKADAIRMLETTFANLNAQDVHEVLKQKTRSYRFCVDALRASVVCEHVRRFGVKQSTVFEAYRFAGRRHRSAVIDAFSAWNAHHSRKELYVPEVADSLALGMSILVKSSVQGVCATAVDGAAPVHITVLSAVCRRAFVLFVLLAHTLHAVEVDPSSQILCLGHVIIGSVLLRYVSFMTRDPACDFRGLFLELALLWSFIVNKTNMNASQSGLLYLAEVLRVVGTQLVLDRIVNEDSGRTASVFYMLFMSACSVTVAVVRNSNVSLSYVSLLSLWALFCIKSRDNTVTLCIEQIRSSYLPYKGERHFVFQADPINIFVIFSTFVFGYLFTPTEYGAFLENNAIHRRIGFNNMCVYFDLFPFSSFAGILLFGNVIGRLGHLLFVSQQNRFVAIVSWCLVILVPYYLLIFIVSPNTSLALHSFGYILFIVSELWYLSISMTTNIRNYRPAWLFRLLYILSIASVMVYSTLACFALLTTIPLPAWAKLVGIILDRVILSAFVMLTLLHITNVLMIDAIHVTVETG